MNETTPPPRTNTVAAVACGLVLALAWMAVPAAAADEAKTYVMKLSTATLNDTQHEWMKRFAASVEKDSAGRIKPELYPASQLGPIPRQIEGTQFGAIQVWVGPPEFLVGVDDRFEVMTAPGVIQNMDQAAKLVTDPELKNMLFTMGEPKGLMGISLYISGPTAFNSRKPIRHLADFKGLKLRTLASPMQDEQVKRLGATPVSMTLGDVLPAIQQGAIDGAVSTVPVFAALQYYDAAKYMTETGQSYVFTLSLVSKKWFDALPADLQKIIIADGAAVEKEMYSYVVDFIAQSRKTWADKGGELIALPPAEQAEMMKTMATIGDDVSKSRPGLKQAFAVFMTAANRAK